MSIYFSPYFLPALLLGAFAFWRLPQAWREPALLAGCAVVLALVQPLFTPVLACVVVLVHRVALIVARGGRFRLLLASVCAIALMLIVLRYMPGMLGAVHLGESAFARSYLVPLGVSYFSFKLLAFLIDVHRGEIRAPRLRDLLLFIFFVPIFPAGPIQRYQEFAGQRAPAIDSRDVVCGLMRISVGFFKKAVVLGVLIEPVVLGGFYRELLSGSGLVDVSSAQVAAFLVGALVYAYVDMSSYADLAIGSSRLFGYRIMENTNYPLVRRNLAEFWRCWHISLSSWCRNNVYLPVLGKTRRPTLAIFSSFVVMGMWHQLSTTWLLWGLWHASGIWLYSRWRRTAAAARLHHLVPGPAGYGLGMLTTVLYAAFGFAFVMMPTAGASFAVLGRALGLS